MRSVSTSARLATVGAVIALAVSAAACGSDDPTPALPEGGTGSAYNDATGVDLTVDATGGGRVVSTFEMTLVAEEYTVTFADIDGGEFTVRGC